MLLFIVQGLCLFLANCDSYYQQLEQSANAKFSLWWIWCKKDSWQIWNHWAKIFVYLWLIWQLSPLKISSTILPHGNQPKMLSKFMASYQIMLLGYETFWWWHILTRVHHRCKLENYGTTWWNSSINTTQWIHYKENITYSLNSMMELKVCNVWRLYVEAITRSFYVLEQVIYWRFIVVKICNGSFLVIYGIVLATTRWGMVLTYRFTLHLMGL